MSNKIPKMKITPRVVLLIFVGVAIAALVGNKFFGARPTQPVRVSPPTVNKEKPVASPEKKEATIDIGKASQPIEAPAPTPVEMPPAVASEGKFVIQVASLQDKARADVVVADLKAKGIEALVVLRDLGDKGKWNRVEVGAFATREDAEPILAKVKEYYKDSFIRQRE